MTQKNHEYYTRDYSAVQRSGFQGWGNSLADRLVEKLSRPYIAGEQVLEIGGSSGEHFAYVKGFDEKSTYYSLDLLPGASDPGLFKTLESLENFKFVKGDAHRIPFPDNTFDRVTSMCVLAHVNDPELVFSELRRVTKHGGLVVIEMPCDPGVVNRLIKLFFTFPKMRTCGDTDPRLTYAREHRNGISNLLTYCRHAFKQDEVRELFYPLRLRTWNLNLFTIIRIRIRKER